MIQQAAALSPEQKAAAELLLGRPLHERESIIVQTFEAPPVSEAQRREVSARLNQLFREVDDQLKQATDDPEEAFTEAMRSSRPGYHTHR